MRVRGLKHDAQGIQLTAQGSHPMRVRGLKLTEVKTYKDVLKVAPHAGAWIETSTQTDAAQLRSVAPHAGAWIET